MTCDSNYQNGFFMARISVGSWFKFSYNLLLSSSRANWVCFYWGGKNQQAGKGIQPFGGQAGGIKSDGVVVRRGFYGKILAISLLS